MRSLPIGSTSSVDGDTGDILPGKLVGAEYAQAISNMIRGSSASAGVAVNKDSGNHSPKKRRVVEAGVASPAAVVGTYHIPSPEKKSHSGVAEEGCDKVEEELRSPAGKHKKSKSKKSKGKEKESM